MPRLNRPAEAPPEAIALGNLLEKHGILTVSSGGRRTRAKKVRTRQ